MDAPTLDAGPTAGGVERSPAAVHRAARSVAGYLAKAPGTHILLLVIAITTLVLRGVDIPTATRILRHQSTNLVQMSQDAPRVLLLSAFLTDQGRMLRPLIEFTVVLVPLERWLGTYRWLAVFVAGHVGASLATTIGIWLQARGGSAGRDILTPVDVGISYGLVAAAGVLTYRFRRPVSIALTLGLLTYYGAGVIRAGSFTDWGHLCALAIGYAIGPLVRRDPAPSERPAGVNRWQEGRVGQAWRWLTAPPEPVRRHVQRRFAMALAMVLLATGVGIVTVLAADGDASIAVPALGDEVHATVLGRPLGCGRACTSTVVRYASPAGSAVAVDALLQTPAHTLLRPGDHLVVRVDPRAATHVLLVKPPRRVRADGFLGVVAMAAALGGLALLVVAGRIRDQPQPAPL